MFVQFGYYYKERLCCQTTKTVRKLCVCQRCLWDAKMHNLPCYCLPCFVISSFTFVVQLFLDYNMSLCSSCPLCLCPPLSNEYAALLFVFSLHTQRQTPLPLLYSLTWDSLRVCKVAGTKPAILHVGMMGFQDGSYTQRTQLQWD